MVPVDNPREMTSSAHILWFVVTLEGQCCIRASLGIKFIYISEHVTVVKKKKNQVQHGKDLQPICFEEVWEYLELPVSPQQPLAPEGLGGAASL